MAGTSLCIAMIAVGIIIGGTKFDERITFWFRDNVPFLDKFSIHISAALVVFGLLLLLTGNC